jgi:HTH-type transcriptional regulator/antitoxin HigA
LVGRFPLRPLVSEEDLDQATALMNTLLDRGDLDQSEEDYLEVLSDLVERYEDKHHPIPTEDLTDGEMLRHLLEARRVTQAAVARATGIRESRISEVISNKRQLTRAQISSLSEYFHVSPTVFIPAVGRAKTGRRPQNRR